MSQLGHRIKIIRKKNNMTQKILADKICSQSVLSRIETGEEVPNAVVLHQLCERLGITVEQVMSNNMQSISNQTELIKKMRVYFDNNRYEELVLFLKESNCINEFHEDVDLQFYYYCLGSCRYYLDKEYKEALHDLQMALEYTYSPNNHYYTNYEILILSCIGKTYFSMGQVQKAFYYLHESLAALSSVSINENTYLLTRIFYNIATTHALNGTYEEAQIYLEKGIQFANQVHNSYYLSELFYEKAIISHLQRNIEVAIEEMYIASGVAKAVDNQELVALTQEKIDLWKE